MDEMRHVAARNAFCKLEQTVLHERAVSEHAQDVGRLQGRLVGLGMLVHATTCVGLIPLHEGEDDTKEAIRVELGGSTHGPSEVHVTKSSKVGVHAVSTREEVGCHDARALCSIGSALRASTGIEGVTFVSHCEHPVHVAVMGAEVDHDGVRSKNCPSRDRLAAQTEEGLWRPNHQATNTFKASKQRTASLGQGLDGVVQSWSSSALADDVHDMPDL